MYGDALAIAQIAERFGQQAIAERFRAKAAEIKRLTQEKLWDPAAQFFKVLPRGETRQAFRRPRTARLHAVVFQSARRRQIGRLEADHGSAGLLRALRADDRRAAASEVRHFLPGPRMPMERPELAVLHRDHA